MKPWADKNEISVAQISKPILNKKGSVANITIIDEDSGPW